MSRWKRDLVIGAAVLAVGYLVFAPTSSQSPSPQITLASIPTKQIQPPPNVAKLEPGNLVPLPRPKSAPSADQTKERTTRVLTAAAIALILVQESRNAYYATGRPCACPEDFTRSGRRCGGNSAYSRPGGAEPLCYPGDVSAALIEKHRARLSNSLSASNVAQR